LFVPEIKLEFFEWFILRKLINVLINFKLIDNLILLKTLFKRISLIETLLEKVEIPMKFRDGIYFFSNKDGIRDGISS
jgi:hypothetical protein